MGRAMKRVRGVVAAGLVAAVAAAAGAEEGFEELFEGKDLAGWVVEGKAEYQEGGETKPVWTVEDERVVCAGKGGGFLRWDRKVCDFVLHVEYRMSQGCNSGIGIRGTKYTGQRRTRPSIAGYEIQILDDGGKSPTKHSTGSLYRYVAPETNPVKPAGEWNVMEVECRGPRIKVTLNGEVIHDLDQRKIGAIDDKPLCGYVSLQNHGRSIEFRGVKMKVIKAAEED